ncbi:MAG: hypothetical protein II916_00575 [Oscillospiraceae bacterium]|nr:hypothetical protein [Oscillospiraceae bacterium]
MTHNGLPENRFRNLPLAIGLALLAYLGIILLLGWLFPKGNKDVHAGIGLAAGVLICFIIGFLT